MSSTILTPASTPTPDQQAPTTSSINLSDIPGHMEHAWEDVKNLFETGDTTGHPEATERAATQERENQEIQNQGEADYKNYVYKNSPDEFKKAHPAEYLYRKAYDTAHQAITEPAEHMLTGKAREEIAPKIDELTEAGLGAAGINKPGESEPVIDTSVIPNPESGIEESLENYHGDRINRAGAPTPKPTPKPAETPAPRVDLSDIPGVKTVQHPVEITTHGPEWDRTHRMNVNGERAGSIGYHVEPNGTARIYGSHVPENMRGQGIGQEGYKSVIDEARNSPNIRKITSDPTNVSPDAARVWQKLKEKGEDVEEITHANGKPGFQIDFKKEPPGNPQVAESAQRYNSTKGQPSIDHGKIALPSKTERNSLADAYDAAQHNPNDPAVQKAYSAMKTETKAQFDHAKNDLGIKVDFTKEDPYKNAQEMQADLKNNHHLSVFTGGDVPKDHPLAETDPETGQSFNNIFRATHDIFGHAAGGHDFSEAGEHSAYGAHAQMYSKDALPAVRKETQGQSNWFFNNKEVRNGKAAGDFPEPKAAILPENNTAGATKRPIKAGSVVDPKIQKVVEDAGGAYRGQNKDGIVEITLPESMTKDLAIRDSLKKDVSVNLHADEVTPEAVKAAMERKVVEYGGSPKTDEVPATGYHPDLQKLADKYGVSDDAPGVRGSGHQASFIAPDGKFIHLPAGTEHPTAIEHVTGSRAAEDIPALGEKVTRSTGPEDSRVRFIKDTGVVRTRFSNDRSGPTLHVSVPEAGVSTEQMQSIKDAVRKSMPNGRGNIVMEVGVPGGKSAEQEFATANNIEPMLDKIGAHPNDWTKKAESMMQESPAGAIDPRTGQADTKGFGVEVFPEARAKREPLDHPPTREDIRSFHDDNKEIFDKHPELRVGWDKTDKGWELNIGASGPTSAGAELVGRKLDQRAVWDIENGQEVPTNGQGAKTKFNQYKLEDRLNDLSGKNVSKLPPTIRNAEHLTDGEKHLLGSNETALRDFKATRAKIASAQELKAAMQAGEPNRFWYDRAKKSFDAMFDSLPEGSYPPEDRNKFIGLVAATSPRSDVTENLAASLKVYRAWKDEGRPTDPNTIRQVIDSSLTMPASHGPNATRALTNQPLSGPKVTSFQQNFMGSATHVTNDMWGAITNGIVNPKDITSEGSYIALSENYRKAAASLGWTPQQGQAASWGFIRTLGNMSGLGGRLAEGAKPASEILKMIDDPTVQKYSADIAEIFLTSDKVRDRLESLGVNLNDFDTKLTKSIEGYGRSSTEQTGRPDPRLLAKSAQRVENAKDFARSEAAKGKAVNEKSAPLFEGQGTSALPAKAKAQGKSEGIPLSWLSKKALPKD